MLKKLSGFTKFSLGLLVAIGICTGFSLTSTHIAPQKASDGDNTQTIIVDGSQLTTTSTKTEKDVVFGDTTFVLSANAKYAKVSTGFTGFSENEKVIYLGKIDGQNCRYIYNKTSIPGYITKFEIASCSAFAVGINFSGSQITSYNPEDPNVYTNSIIKDSIVTLSDSDIPANCSYFFFQNTSSGNNTSQVQFRISYTPFELESIDVIDPYTVYDLNSEFVKPTVIATYENGSTVDVTESAIFSEFNSALLGKQTIDVEFGGKETSYDVTVVQPKYSLLSDKNDLQSGQHFLIIGKKEVEEELQYYSLLPFVSGDSNCKGALIEAESIEDNTISTTNKNIKLGNSGKGWALFDGSNYLYAAGGTNNNHLKGDENVHDGTGEWTIEIGDNDAVIITCLDSSVTKNLMRFNATSTLFSCYASGQKDIYLYLKSSFVLFSAGKLGDKVENMPENIYVPEGSTLTMPEDPVCEGYIFDGWYCNNDKWNFDTPIFSNIELTAKWKTKVDDITPQMGIGYKYSFNDFEEYTGGGLNTGDQIYIISQFGGKYYAPTHTLSSNSLTAYEITDFTTRVEECVFNVEENNGAYSFFYYDTQQAKQYLKLSASDGNINNFSSTPVETNLLDLGEGNYGLSRCKDGDYDLVLCYRNYNNGIFKPYRSTYITPSSTTYANHVSIYVKKGGHDYKDVDFRMKLGANGLSSYAESIDADNYGIRLTTDSEITVGNEVFFYDNGTVVSDGVSYENTAPMYQDGDISYFVLKFGDVLNYKEKASVEFTIQAFVVINGEMIVSNNTKTYSIKSMVKAYHDDPKYTKELDELYNILCLDEGGN